MSEMLFVEVLRRHIDALPPEQTGWLAGMRDPAVGRALALLHERPAAPWTLEQLGAEAGLSRAFKREVGVAPGAWRRGQRGIERSRAAELGG